MKKLIILCSCMLFLACKKQNYSAEAFSQVNFSTGKSYNCHCTIYVSCDTCGSGRQTSEYSFPIYGTYTDAYYRCEGYREVRNDSIYEHFCGLQ